VDWLTFMFVLIIMVAAVTLTLTVRNQILRNVERRREDQHQLEEDLRKQTALRGNPRSVTRRPG
jgi:heme exporter protein D